SQISNAAVNTFPGLVHTARHVMKVGNTRSQWPKLVRELSKVGSAIGTKSEQGSRTGRCGWITSFLRSFIYKTYRWEVSWLDMLVVDGPNVVMPPLLNRSGNTPPTIEGLVTGIL